MASRVHYDSKTCPCELPFLSPNCAFMAAASPWPPRRLRHPLPPVPFAALLPPLARLWNIL